MTQTVLERRLQVADLRAAVVAPSRQAHGEHALVREQRGDRVGELDLAARARHDLGQQLEDARREHVAPDDAEVRRRVEGFGFSTILWMRAVSSSMRSMVTMP